MQCNLEEIIGSEINVKNPVCVSELIDASQKKTFIFIHGVQTKAFIVGRIDRAKTMFGAGPFAPPHPTPTPPPQPTSKPISSSQDSLVRAYCTAGQGAGTLLTRERMMLTGWNAEGLQDGGRELFRPKAQEGQDANTHPATVHTGLFFFFLVVTFSSLLRTNMEMDTVKIFSA